MPFEWKLIIYRKWLNVRVNVCSCDWTTSLVSASDLSCATLGEKEASEGRREERSSRKRGVRCFFATKKGCNSSSLLLSIIWISFSHWILISQSPNWQDLLLSNQQPKTTEFIMAKKKKWANPYISLICCCYSKGQMHHFSQFCFVCWSFIDHSVPWKITNRR